MRNKRERDATHVTNQLIEQAREKNPKTCSRKESGQFTSSTGRRHYKERHQTLITYTAGRIPRPPKDYSS